MSNRQRLTSAAAEYCSFALDVHNTGLSDAWNATLVDGLPHSSAGAMCSATPQFLSAQVFAADGVTPATGNGALVVGSDDSPRRKTR